MLDRFKPGFSTAYGSIKKGAGYLYNHRPGMKLWGGIALLSFLLDSAFHLPNERLDFYPVHYGDARTMRQVTGLTIITRGLLSFTSDESMRVIDFGNSRYWGSWNPYFNNVTVNPDSNANLMDTLSQRPLTLDILE
jgi:hypothetical protein